MDHCFEGPRNLGVGYYYTDAVPPLFRTRRFAALRSFCGELGSSGVLAMRFIRRLVNSERTLFYGRFLSLVRGSLQGRLL